MRQKEILIDPIDIDADGIAAAQAVAGAGALTLNGALIVDSIFTSDNDGSSVLARQISITSDGADNGRTFTVTGTDPDGKAQTEDITGPSTATVESDSYWATVTEISADAACAGNISSGTVDEFVTNTIPIENSETDGSTVSLENFTGAINVTIEEAFSRIQYTDNIAFYTGPTALQGVTAQATDQMSIHASALRLKCNSYTSGAQLSMVINQNRQF